MALFPRRAGDRGALRAGVHPSLLPGGRRLSDEAERAEIEGAWGSLPAEGGRSTRQILRACASREIDVLFLIGIDPLRDIPDADLVRRALSNTRHVVVQSLELGSLEPFADAFLPAAAWVEREGHATDWEGRSQSIHPVRDPAGVSRPDWEIFVGLAEAVGRPLGFEDLGALRAEAVPLLEPRSVTSRSTAWTGTGRPQRLGELTLLSYPLLVDEGRLSEGSDELKAALGQDPFVELHPEDADKRGLADGGRATVTTDAGQAVLEARVTEHIAPGAAFVPFNQPGLAANELLSGSFTTAVRIEPSVAEPAVAGAEPAVAQGAA
jgi:NADH-quinone oxidoreductase subunit G